MELAPNSTLALQLRIPGWVVGEVPVFLNGNTVTYGIRGSYCTLERDWQAGDTIRFTLPMRLRASRYQGLDSVGGCERYAIEWGALLLGAVGRLDARGRYLLIDHNPETPETWAVPIDRKPGHFSVHDKPGCRLIPYYKIGDEVFTSYPIFRKS